MTEANNPAAEPAPDPGPAKSTPGEYLRKLREEKGHTHAVVGNALHLTVHYVKALEGDEYGKLPGLTFVKGYLRAYARFLGGDVDRVLALFDEHIAGLLDAGMHTARVERSKRRQDQALRWGIGAGFVVVAGLVAGWWFMSGEPEPPGAVARTAATQSAPAVAQPQARTAAAPPPVTTPVAGAGTTPPASTTTFAATLPQNPVNAAGPAAPQTTDGPTAATPGTVPDATVPASATTQADLAPASDDTAADTTATAGARQVSLIGAGDDELRVTFNGSSWIEVDDGSQVRLFQDMLSAGDTLTIRGAAPFHVLLGDATKVDLSLNAAAVDISADIRDDSSARVVLGASAGDEDAQEVPL